MYEAFYGLREKPFSLIPAPDFLYLGEKHEAALGLLEYSLREQTAFSMITGDIGTGKTTLIRHLLNRLDKDMTVGLVTNTQRSFGELLPWILLAFDLNYRGKDKGELYQTLVEFLLDQHAQQRRTVLIFDEAQNMSIETLEELRLLSNLNADKHPVMQVVLVGQVGLRETLRRPELEQFAQRVGIDYHLEPLSCEETHRYIQHHLKVAGAEDRELFDADAQDVVFHYSGGIPRLINLLCDTALVYGFAAQRERVDAALIEEVAREKQRGEVFPLRARNSLADPGEARDRVQRASMSAGAERVQGAIREHREADPAEDDNPFSQADSPDTQPQSTEDNPWETARSEPGTIDFGGFDLKPPDPPYRSGGVDTLSSEHAPKRRPARSYSQLAMGAAIGVIIGIAALLGFAWSSPWFNLGLGDELAFLNSTKTRLMAHLGYAGPTGHIQTAARAHAFEMSTDPDPDPDQVRIPDEWQQRIGEPRTPSVSETMDTAHGPYPGEISATLPNGGTAVTGMPRDVPSPGRFVPSERRAPVSPGRDNPARRTDAGSSSDRTAKRQPDKPRVIVVRPGDNLSDIIMDAYGMYDENILKSVLRKNPHIRRPNQITAGEVVTLPAR
jgi:type II secretory pathway predicted ATPase ExeA